MKKATRKDLKDPADAAARALFLGKGRAAAVQFVEASHLIDGVTAAELAVAHAIIRLYRVQLAEFFEQRAGKYTDKHNAYRAMDAEDARRLRDREPLRLGCTTCPTD